MVIDSLKAAFDSGRVPEMIYTDGGSQYRSQKFKALMEGDVIIHSVSPPGTPIDNAVIESFFNTFKKELVYPNKDLPNEQMRLLIIEYLEEYYPKKRPHTTIGMTPEKFDKSNK